MPSALVVISALLLVIVKIVEFLLFDISALDAGVH